MTCLAVLMTNTVMFFPLYLFLDNCDQQQRYIWPGLCVCAFTVVIGKCRYQNPRTGSRLYMKGSSSVETLRLRCLQIVHAM